MGGREGEWIMERMMLVEEMKMAMHSLGNINTSVLSSGWAVSLCLGTPLQLKDKVAWRKKKGLEANKALSPTRYERTNNQSR